MMPLIGLKKVGHWVNVVLLYVLIGGFVVLTVMAFKKDASDPAYIADVNKAHEQAERVNELIEFNDGIPPEGALSLLYSDPLTQGPRLFATNCASCHAYGYDDGGNALDGTNKKLSDKQSAPNLKGVGSREWISKVLTVEHYGSDEFFGNTNFKEGKMLEFLVDTELEEEDVTGLAAALSSEAKLKSQSDIDNKDLELIANGFEWMGEDELACVDCHKVKGEGGKKGPDLTAYMSRQWLVDFIGNSSHERFYGDDNDRMPNFLDAVSTEGEIKQGKLDQKSVELIVDWLRGEYVDK
jgi:ubiquinol-cytochrome c reductase cytochrome b subunit